MVTTGYLKDSQVLPLVVRPSAAGVDAQAWAAENRAWVDTELLTAGAMLFRGFGIGSADEFNRFVEALAGKPLEYRERSSPRSQVTGNIYTSTDYPPEFPIFLHNENSYSSTWPLKLLFYCLIPAVEGGETPIADSRRIFQRIKPEVRQKFGTLGVMYVRNFGKGLGLPWTTVFQTDDPHKVEEYCRDAGIQVEWRTGGGLRTRHVRPAIQHHPKTGDEVWFNHATFFHVTTLEPMIRDVLMSSYAPDELPNNTFYGDGSPLEPDVLDHLRSVYRAETVLFPWERGDVMLVDNMLAAHGRSAFKGERKVLVAMTDSMSDRPKSSVLS